MSTAYNGFSCWTWMSKATLLLSCVASASLAMTPIHAVAATGSTIDLNLYQQTFSDEFNEPTLDIPSFSKRWFPHTPWWGDFGDAAFTDPQPGFPFTLGGGLLRIEARKDQSGKWRSGLIASTDPTGKGFAQTYGYFEIRAKLPPGEGVWPAFWLDSVRPKDSKEPSTEVDIFEYYGQFPTTFHSTVTVWPKDGSHNKSVSNKYDIGSVSLTDSFHTYGASVEKDYTVIYFDRKEIWRTATPQEHKYPLTILANLALGSGWPIVNTKNPSYMYIDYIRAYKKK